ncbi:Na+/H+ antiporter family protein [Neofamilia massiliensis]|uniref:Na+/H+ antiporter family protein n=1 Tax=Neofamilia massiliensis TaxID=1673724 RepID=UPI0006BB61DB|nr:Na+/H+ antiporter NhaC family protein [Neofamilia massiliensis]
MSIITNPVVVSVIVLSALCLLKFNILLALIVAAIVGGLLGGMPLAAVKDSFTWLPGTVAQSEEIPGVVDVLIDGMGGNSATALAYILLGVFAVGLARSGLGTILSRKLSGTLGKSKAAMVFTIAAVGCLSQNLIPIHIAYMPILIPPLLGLMNQMKLDRRAMAIALTFSVKAPYIVIPAGFGLIFQGIIRDQVNANGLNVTIGDVTSVNWIGGLSMLIGLIIMATYFMSKPREYEDLPIIGQEEGADEKEVTMNKQAWAALIGAIVTAFTSIATESLPLSALFGVLTMLILGGIKFSELDDVVNGGIGMMGFIAFVMLVAAGYGAVLSATGAVESLVKASAAAMHGNKAVAAFVMLLIGLLITMGIGSSFSTIPIIATIFVPLGLELGFSPKSIILLVALAGALGDAGSPASDSTLGPTSALNADGQHDHIWDSCVPSFIAFNIPLIIGGVIGTMILG